MRRREGARSLRDGARWNGLDGQKFRMGRVGGRELVRGRPCAECRAGHGAGWVFLSRGFCGHAPGGVRDLSEKASTRAERSSACGAQRATCPRAKMLATLSGRNTPPRRSASARAWSSTRASATAPAASPSWVSSLVQVPAEVPPRHEQAARPTERAVSAPTEPLTRAGVDGSAIAGDRSDTQYRTGVQERRAGSATD